MERYIKSRLKYLVGLNTEHADANQGYIGLENVESWSGKKLIIDSPSAEGVTLSYQKGDILFGKLRPYLAKCYKAEENGCCSTEFLVLRPKRILPKYLQYRILSSDFIDKVNMSTYGAKMPRANWSFIGNMDIMVPPSYEQQSIADYLDDHCAKIDDIIAEAKASIEEYKELRASTISGSTTHGIRYKRKMKESGIEWLPQIPIEWDDISAKALFVQRKDRAIPGERQLTASQKRGIMYQDEYMQEEGIRIVVVEKDLSILKHVEPDDFVISMRSFQGGLEYSYLKGCISSAYVMLIPNHDYVDSEYYKWLFKSDKYINALQSTSDLIRDGQALRYANFVKLRLFTVPLAEQKEIADYLNKRIPQIDELITEKQVLIKDLETYRKSLIYEVVTGKRKVVGA